MEANDARRSLEGDLRTRRTTKGRVVWPVASLSGGRPAWSRSKGARMSERYRGLTEDSLGSDFRAAKDEAVKQLLWRSKLEHSGQVTYHASPRHDRNVVGVGIGRKHVARKGTSAHAIRIYVRNKLPKGSLGKHLIPAEFNGIPTDVVETGDFRALTRGLQATLARTRPLAIGLSIGFASAEDFIAGTIGAIVERGSDRFVLSNNHVLAFENRNPVGTVLLQPATLDAGRSPQDRVGVLSEYTPLTRRGNRVDAAIGKIDDAIATRAAFAYGVSLASAEPFDARTEMQIQKLGRGTGLTFGRVADVSVNVSVDFATGRFAFEEQILLRGNDNPFASDGDSGSLVVATGQKRPVALLFAGSESHALATPIHRVLDSFGVTILI